MVPGMKTKPLSQTKSHGNRQIVGFSLPPELATEVKEEAATRKIRLRALFTEIWALYKKERTK